MDYKKIWYLFNITLVVILVILAIGQITMITLQENVLAQNYFLPNQIIFSSTQSGNADLWMMGLDGTNPMPLITAYNSQEIVAACDSRGQFLIFDTDREGDRELYRMDYAGTELRPLTGTQGENFAPVWSPTEQIIAFVSTRNGDADIWTMDSGGGNVRQITFETSDELMPSWSADGQKLIYSAYREGSFDVFSYDLSTNLETQLTYTENSDEIYPAYAPDGMTIAYIVYGSLYVLRDAIQTELVYNISDGTLESPVWLSDTEILLTAIAGEKSDIIKLDLTTQATVNLTNDGTGNRYARPCYIDSFGLEAIAAQPTVIPPTSTPTVTPTLTPSATPLISPTFTSYPTATFPPLSIPPSHRLTGLTQIWQLFNRCSASALTILLSYYNTGVTRDQCIRYLNPAASDVSVRLEEMIAFVEQQGLKAVFRSGGTPDLLKALVANGFPVLVENAYYHEGQTWDNWMSHNRIIMGYDNQFLYSFDSLLGNGEDGQGRPILYREFDELWRHFNRDYLVAYRPTEETLLQRVLAEQWDKTANAQYTLTQAQADYNTYNDSFSLFNIGAAQTHLGQYTEAAATFDRVRTLGLPWRFFWYRFEMFEAYLAVGRYNDVLNLTREVFNGTDGVDEMYYYIARAYEGLEDYERATTNYNFVVERTNGRYVQAQEGLDRIVRLSMQPTATPAAPIPTLVLQTQSTDMLYQATTSPANDWLRSRETWIGDEFAFVLPKGLPTESIRTELIENQLSLVWDDDLGTHKLTFGLEVNQGALSIPFKSYTVNEYWVDAQINGFADQLAQQILFYSLRPTTYYLEDIELTSTNITFVLRMPAKAPAPAPSQYVPHQNPSTIPDNWFISTELWTPGELLRLAESAGIKGITGIILDSENLRYNWTDEQGEHALTIMLGADPITGDLEFIPIDYAIDGVTGDLSAIQNEIYLLREGLLLNSIPPSEFFLSRIEFGIDSFELIFLIPPAQ